MRSFTQRHPLRTSCSGTNPWAHTLPAVPRYQLKPGQGPQTLLPARQPLLKCSAAASALSDLPKPLDLPYAEILKRGPSRQAALPTPPKQADFRHVLPYLLKLALDEKRLWWRAGGALLCLFASKAAGLMCPLMIKRAVDSFTIHAAEPVSVVLYHATQCLMLYGLCDILKHVSKELQAPLFTPLSQAAARRVAYHTFSHVLDLDIKFHLDRRTGRLSRILERGTRSIQMLYRAVIFTFAPTALELIFVCSVLANTFSPLVGGLVLATFAAYVSWSIVMTQVATEARKHVNELDNATSAKAVDALLSYETVTLFNNQALEVGQYNEYLKAYMTASITTDRLAAVLNAGQAVILAVGLCSIMITALHTAGPAVSPGDLVMIQGLLLQLWAPLQFLGWFYRELRSALVDMEEFFAILRSSSHLVDGNRPVPPLTHTTTSHTPAAAAEHTNGSAASVLSSNGSSVAATDQAGLLVELQDVKFGYSPEREVLKGLSLKVQPGKSLALVGTSGSGKSTVLKLLTRLYDVTDGSVMLNGCDVRDLTLESLRGSVAVVPQETTLFNDTILQNIRYGKPDASDDEVIRAARMAHLDGAVARMPKGYQTVVGERGLKLSGGEKQRVAIARAFLKQPRLLICDEATSALDSETEKQIMASLDELAQGRTSVFVAHRLSTVKECDAIAVLRDGQLVELGSHEELMQEATGIYRRMWWLQAKEAAKMSSNNSGAAEAGGQSGQDSDTSDSEGQQLEKVMAVTSA